METYSYIFIIGIMTLGASLIMFLADQKTKKLDKNHFILKYHTPVSIVVLLMCALSVGLQILALTYQGFSMNDLPFYLLFSGIFFFFLFTLFFIRRFKVYVKDNLIYVIPHFGKPRKFTIDDITRTVVKGDRVQEIQVFCGKKKVLSFYKLCIGYQLMIDRLELFI